MRITMLFIRNNQLPKEMEFLYEDLFGDIPKINWEFRNKLVDEFDKFDKVEVIFWEINHRFLGRSKYMDIATYELTDLASLIELQNWIDIKLRLGV